MNQIKSMLLFQGKSVHPTLTLREKWSQAYLEWVESVSWEYEALKKSMEALLALYRHLDSQLKELTIDQRDRSFSKNRQLQRKSQAFGKNSRHWSFHSDVDFNRAWRP